MNTSQEIDHYLYYGYVPNVDEVFIKKILEAKDLNLSFKYPANSDVGASVLKDTFIRLSGVQGSGVKHVIPLSGGLDSRAILGGLLGCVEPSSILTVTFGSPGAWDYEIGRMISQKMGIHNEQIDLGAATWRWRTEDLVCVAKELDSPIWIFDKYVNSDIVRRFDSADVCFWTGFMGDPIAGSHLRNAPSSNWVNAQKYFCDKNRFSKNIDLCSNGYSPLAALPSEPLFAQDLLTLEEQLDFAVRQAGPIRKIVAPDIGKYVIPFLDSSWVSFMLNAGFERRLGLSLYKEVLRKFHPALFSLPTKTYKGLPLTATSLHRYFNSSMLAVQSWIWNIKGKDLLRTRALNYIDFDFALRQSGEFNIMAKENLFDLKKRRICDWINIEEIWTSHIKNNQNLGREITQLISLEIYLKSRK